MKYDFVEIGTSDFDTLIELANDSTIGLSIEPINEYLKRLPNKPNVTKINAAISIDGTDSPVNIFYVKHNLLDEFYPYVRGCNKIGSCHPLLLQHENIQKDPEKYIEKTLVNQITFKQLYSTYKIEDIDLLKIDTEGFDCVILNLLMDYLEDTNSENYPKKIIFETNFLTDMNLIIKTIDRFVNVGYVLQDFTWNKTDGSSLLILKD